MSLPSELLPVGLLGTGAAADTGYQIPRSLRFNSADSAYLGPKTLSSPTSSTAWTWAGWIKKTLITTSTDFRGIFTARSAADNYAYLDFSDNGIRFANRPPSGTIAVLQTTPVFRDPSAWFHLVFVYDSANATSGDTLRLYINGTRVTTFSSATYPSASQASIINSAVAHYIGYDSQNTAYVDGYLADIHFIDGQALDPSSFGEFDTNNVWQPKAYAGTYGTNGFHLPFSDNSTAAALGTDTSGNGNTWTVNNISVTAGAGNDSLVDSPTNYGTDSGAGGEVRGNYCTLNPLDKANLTLSNGNLDLTHSGTTGNWQMVRATIGVSSGKWYWETTVTDTETILGIAKSAASIANDNYVGNDANGWGYSGINGQKLNSGSGSAYGNSYTSGDVIGVAFDADAGSLYFYKNGTVQNSGTAAFTSLTSGPYFPAFSIRDTGHTSSVNLGQRPFAYTAPSGFKALCTTNLPDPTIADGSTAMDIALYTGNGSTQTISGLNFSPDLVWIKARNAIANHAAFDIIRGANKAIYPSLTNAEDTYTATLNSFDSSGFTLGYDDWSGVNASGHTFVAWTWDAGSSTVSNTDGSITSQVRANPSAGFSVVTYTGTGATATVGHGLGAAPGFIIIKRRDGAVDWVNYHSALGPDKYLQLSLTSAATTSSGYWGTVNSSTFGLPSFSTPNASGGTYVAYCWAPVDGYSSFGSYTGNGSTDGPFVYTGHRSRFLLIKRSDGVANWQIYDTARDPYNAMDSRIKANASDAEVSNSGYNLDILSNGFKPTGGNNDNYNASGFTYIYASFAEHPLATARAR